MFPYFQNQTWPYAPLSCSLIPSVYQYYNFNVSFPQPYVYNYTIGASQNNSFSTSNQISQTRTAESLINYKDFNFKNQVRRVHDGKYFSYISNLNTANHLISYNDEKNRTVYDIFRNSYKTLGNN